MIKEVLKTIAGVKYKYIWSDAKMYLSRVSDGQLFVDVLTKPDDQTEYIESTVALGPGLFTVGIKSSSIFDIVVKDHKLEGEDLKGYGLMGSTIAKTDYPDFYEKCLEEYNSGTNNTTEISDVTIKVCTNGHRYYDIKNKSVVQKVSGYLYGIDTSNETITLPTAYRYLIDKKEPTSSDMTGYNIYSDNWCEQFGITENLLRSATLTITFPKPFKQTPIFNCNMEVTQGEVSEMNVGMGNTTNNTGTRFVTPTAATLYGIGYSGSGSDGGPIHWHAKGYISAKSNPISYVYMIIQ